VLPPVPPAGQPPLAGGGDSGFISTGNAIVWEQIEKQYPFIAETVWGCAFAPVCQDVLAGAAAGVLVYEGVQAGIQIYQASQRGKGDMRDTGITQEAQQLVQEGRAPDICSALDQLMRAAKASGEMGRQQRIKRTQKGFGCRPSRQTREIPR